MFVRITIGLARNNAYKLTTYWCSLRLNDYVIINQSNNLYTPIKNIFKTNLPHLNVHCLFLNNRFCILFDFYINIKLIYDFANI